MTSTTSRMGLVIPSSGFDHQLPTDYAANMDKIDAAPGIFSCLSTARPTWTSAQSGRTIYETDTRLGWMWTGSTWVRLSGSGLLQTSGGGAAYIERADSTTWTGTTVIVVLALTGVLVPAGNRPLKVEVNYPKAIRAGGTGIIRGSICQASTVSGGPYLTVWSIANNTLTSENSKTQIASTYDVIIPAGLAAGTYDFSLQAGCNQTGGTNTVGASVDSGAAPTQVLSPCTLSVTEL